MNKPSPVSTLFSAFRWLANAASAMASRSRRIAALTAAAGMPVDFHRLDRPVRTRPMAVRRGVP